jgi:hypothetical protein
VCTFVLQCVHNVCDAVVFRAAAALVLCRVVQQQLGSRMKMLLVVVSALDKCT